MKKEMSKEMKMKEEIGRKSQVRIRNIILVIGVLLVTWVFVFAAPVLNYVAPSVANDTYLSNTLVVFNVSIVESALDELIWNWNGTNSNKLNLNTIKW